MRMLHALYGLNLPKDSVQLGWSHVNCTAALPIR
jgi:hypothetical protein